MQGRWQWRGWHAILDKSGQGGLSKGWHLSRDLNEVRKQAMKILGAEISRWSTKAQRQDNAGSIWKSTRPVQWTPYTRQEGPLPSASASESLAYHKHTHTQTQTQMTNTLMPPSHRSWWPAVVTAQPVILNSCPHDWLYPGSRQLFLHIFCSVSSEQKAPMSDCKGLLGWHSLRMQWVRVLRHGSTLAYKKDKSINLSNPFSQKLWTQLMFTHNEGCFLVARSIYFLASLPMPFPGSCSVHKLGWYLQVTYGHWEHFVILNNAYFS